MDIRDVIELVKQAKPFIQNRDMADHIKVKGPADYVTQVDTNVQKFLSEKLYELAPQIQFLGEEEGLHAMSSDTFWILDPVDGTTNLIHDYQHSTVSLGLYEKGEIVMGVIYDPFREEVFHAEKGKGSFRNGEPIHVASAGTLEETIIAIGTAPYQKELAHENFQRFERIFMKCQDIRRTGSAAMDLAYTACGRIGGFFEARLQPWDFAAGMLLVEEAGGKITRFDGSAVNPVEPGGILATNGKLHEEIRKLLW